MTELLIPAEDLQGQLCLLDDVEQFCLGSHHGWFGHEPVWPHEASYMAGHRKGSTRRQQHQKTA